MPNSLLQKQLEKFDEKFVEKTENGLELVADYIDGELVYASDIKSFLSECHKETIESIIEMAEKQKLKTDTMDMNEVEELEVDLFEMAYNKALSDLISSLKEMIK